jgi:AmmeMemoRadiSam system protein B/AmmeMemoRadiSam system protein A
MKKVLLAIVVAAAAAIADAASRPPAVAGAFYTADPGVLRKQVQALLANAARPAKPARALVVPHAGYAYSGATAAEAFAHLDGSDIRRVILLGPSHHVGFGGGALPAPRITAFATPLGDVALDRDAMAVLRSQRDFGGPADAHDPEHSLEVELPFLQLVVPGAKIVPVLVGFNTDRDDARRMAEGLCQLLDGHTAVVVSSDFTHHGARYGYAPFEVNASLERTLVGVARSTGGRLAAADADGFWYQVEVSGDTVCGRRPLAVLGELLAHAFDGSGRVLDVTTSVHVSGNWDLSVTYVAVAYDGSWTEWTERDKAPELGRLSAQQGKVLLRLARATLTSHLEHDASLADWFASQSMGAELKSQAGAFVTVNNVGDRARREGRLRACMGVIEARQPMMDAVIHAAVSAAHDPRFPPLEKSGRGEFVLEVSVLSPTRRVPGPQAIRVGEHGVVLSKGGRSAVFLPQVAVEQGWDRNTMLDHLSRKAGLNVGAWREGAEFKVFTAQVFTEGS